MSFPGKSLGLRDKPDGTGNSIELDNVAHRPLSKRSAKNAAPPAVVNVDEVVGEGHSPKSFLQTAQI